MSLPAADEARPLILRGPECRPPGLGIRASSEKQKSIAHDCQVTKYILAISGFRKRLLFPLSFPSLHAGATSLEIPAYGGGELTKTANKEIKTIVNNVSDGYPFPTLKRYKNLHVGIDLYFPLNILHPKKTSTQQLPSGPTSAGGTVFSAFKVSYPLHSCSVNNRPI